MFTLLLPIWKPAVVKLTLAPTLAPALKLPVVIVRIVLLTTADPIVRLSGDILAVDVEFDTLTIEFVMVEFTVLLPTKTEDVLMLTFDPTFA